MRKKINRHTEGREGVSDIVKVLNGMRHRCETKGCKRWAFITYKKCNRCYERGKKITWKERTNWGSKLPRVDSLHEFERRVKTVEFRKKS